MPCRSRVAPPPREFARVPDHRPPIVGEVQCAGLCRPRACPKPGSTSCPHLPEPARAAAAPGHPRAGRAPTTWPRCSRWRSSARRCRPSPGSTSRARCSTSCGCGGRRRSVRARPARAGARHAGAHLLQGRVGLAGRLAQAEHRRPPGLLQQGGGDQAAHHRDRRRPVGERARLRLRPLRARVQGLHGPGLVRAEAVPPGDDGDLGRRGGRRRRSTSPTAPARSGWRSATPSATPPAATTPTTRSDRCSTTCCCTRP